MVRTEVKISMKKKYSACLYFKLLKSYPNKYIYSRLHLIANRLIAKFVLLQKKLKHRSIYHSFNVKTRG